MKNGVTRITEERLRQLEKLEYSADHDAEHDSGQLAIAAACYATAAAHERIYTREEFSKGFSYFDPWPWEPSADARPYTKDGSALKDPTPEQAIRLLEKAGALIAAEIDRLLRVKEEK